MKIVAVKEFLQVLHELYPAATSPLADDELVCPSHEWVRDTFVPWALPQMPRYKASQFDCENFSLRAHDRFSECLRASENPEFVGKGEAFCRCAIELNSELNGVPASGNRRHVTNLYLDDHRRLWFLEMQNGWHTDAVEAVKNRVCIPYYYGLI